MQLILTSAFIIRVFSYCARLGSFDCYLFDKLNSKAMEIPVGVALFSGIYEGSNSPLPEFQSEQLGARPGKISFAFSRDSIKPDYL